MIKIVFADDHQALLDGFAAYLKYNDEMKIVGSAKNGKELVELVRKLNPNIVLTDVRMPIMDGIEATKIIKQEFPFTKIIAFSMFDQKETVQNLMSAGANGYLLKNSGLKMLCEAISKVKGGETFYDPNLPSSFFTEEAITSNRSSIESVLSRREKEILYHISQGKISKEIADILFLSKTTIDTHRKNMTRKLGLSGSNSLFQYALEKKLSNSE